MMKKHMLLFMIFALTSMQVMALNCSVSCTLQDSLQTAKNMDMAGHECCHGSEDKNENKKSTNCMHSFSDACFHEYSSDVVLKYHSEKDASKIEIIEWPILALVKEIGIHERYLPKIPHQEFLKFKASRTLYLLKDQFLI